MDEKNKDFVHLKSKETGVAESAAKENKSDSVVGEPDNEEYVTKCEIISESVPEVEVTVVQSFTSQDKLVEVAETGSQCKEIKAIESSFFKCKELDTESAGKDTCIKCDKSKPVNKKEIDSTSNDDVPVFFSPEHSCDRNIPSKVMKSSDKFPEPPVIPQDHTAELPMTHVIDEAKSGTGIQEYDTRDMKRQGPLARLPEMQMEKVVDSNDSQNTEHMNVELLKPPHVFRDVEEVPAVQVEETAKESSDSDRKVGQDREGGGEEGSSEETYCSESSFHRTEHVAHRNFYIVLESDNECHQLSGGTESLGGASQASTVDIADLEVVPCSEADMFASQNEVDAEVSGELPGTVPDYSDFVKGSRGSTKLMQSSTTLSADGSQDSSSTPQTSRNKSVRKLKQDESSLSHPPPKLQWIAGDDKGENVNTERARNVKEKSSVCFDAVPSLPIHSCSTDDVAQNETIVQAVFPSKVTQNKKVVVLEQNANEQQHSVLASPKEAYKPTFETELGKQKPQFVVSCSSSNGSLEEVEFKTDQYKKERVQDGAVSVQHSDEIEVQNYKKLRQSTEVPYVSSHSYDSTKSSSHNGTSAGRKRSPGDTVEVTDTENDADEERDADSESKCSTEEFVLHLSYSPSENSVYHTPVSDKNDSSRLVSFSADLTGHSYTCSNGGTSNLESDSDQETFDATKQNSKHVSSSFNSEGQSVYAVHKEEMQEEHDKPPQKDSESTTDMGHTVGSCNVTRQKPDIPFSLSVKDDVSPVGSHCVTDSLTAFSRVKDTVQITSVKLKPCVVPVVSERPLRLSKRKRSGGKQDTPVGIAISDSDCSTPVEVQKKAKMETTDTTAGHDDTPSSLPPKVSAFQQKGVLGLHSTPQMDRMTPAKQPSASSIEQDSMQETDIEWEVILKVKVKHLNQSGKDIYRVQQCEDITEDIAQHTPRMHCNSSSSGGLGDISSKNTSPSSTASGGGPFPLQPHRLSLISASSGTSTSSGGSSLVQGVMSQKCAINGGPFLIPNHRGLKVPRDQSFRSEEVLCGMQPGICSPIVDGCGIIHKMIISSHPESYERDQGRITRTVKSDSGKKSDIQKPDDGSLLHDGPVMMKTDDVSSSLADSDAVPVPADVLKETPRSTVKHFNRGRSGPSVKKHSLLQSCSELIVERRKGRISSVQDKAPILSAVEDVATLIVKSEMMDSLNTVTRSIHGTSEDSTASLDCSQLELGTLVFARWTDKKYYSGRIQERYKDGRWKVLFDDTSVKLIPEEFVIAVDILPDGQLVYALTGRMDYESGIIINVVRKCNVVKYAVELDDGSFVTVSRSALCMTEDQAEILREMVDTSLPTKGPHRADVSLDNVLQGKRRIGSRDMENKLDSPGVSGMSKASPGRKVSSPSRTESDTSSTVEDIDGVEQESHAIKLGKVKGLGRRTPRKNMSALLGPVPPAGSKIFAGKSFLLTNSDVQPLCVKREEVEGYDSECQCSACGLSQNILFSRSHLTQQINAGSGKLYDRFEDVPPSNYDLCYLISDRPSQTAKYILCLAYGIQLVAHSWIIESCKAGICKPVEIHLLAAGWSLEKQVYCISPNKQPLSCVNIGLVSGAKHFLKYWKLVLKGAGANVFVISREPYVEELEHLDVVVSSHSCPAGIQKQLEQLGRSPVSTEWIVQCLINGSKVPTHSKTTV